jgi:hypothetical protein
VWTILTTPRTSGRGGRGYYVIERVARSRAAGAATESPDMRLAMRKLSSQAFMHVLTHPGHGCG